MNRHLALPLSLFLLVGTASAQDGAGTAPGAEAKPAPAPEEKAPQTLKDLPKAAPRAPLPADPSEKIKKPIQAALLEWFGNDPGMPGKRAATEVQGDRQSAAGKLEKAAMEWNALLGAAGASWGSLRNVAWWKARMDETQPKVNRTGKIEKIEFVYKEKKYQLAVSVPKAYRGNGTEVYPLILTCIDKDADPKKVFPAIYGPLLDTHVVVASFENNLKDSDGRDIGSLMFYGVYWAETNVRIDRDRIVLDAVGKGARFVDELAGDMALQWNGAVFRNPTSAPELIGNLALFPCCAILPTGAPETMTKAVDAIVAASPSPPSLVATGAAEDATLLGSVQQWIGALKPRKVSDQREPYTYWMRSRGRAHWGYWFKKLTAVDATTENPYIKVSVSRDPEKNAVVLETTNLDEGEILLNDEVLDLDQPVTIVVNGIVVKPAEKPVRSLMTTFHAGEGLLQTKFGPRNYFITWTIHFRVTGDALIPESERKALAEAKRRIEEEAKNPPVAPPKEGAPADDHPKEAAPAEAPPKEAAPAEAAPKEAAPAEAPKAPATAPSGPWPTDYAAALEQAKKESKALLVHFAGAADAAGQAAVDKALVDASLQADLLRYVCVRLPVDGDAGKDAKARLEKIAAGAAAPFLAVLKADDESVTGKFAAATAKEEEILPEIKKLVAPPPPPPPPPVEKPKDEVKKDAAPAETPKAEEKKEGSK